jgi:calcineurin-like phosphoesterase family protein
MTNKELLDLYVQDLKTIIRVGDKVRPKYYKWKMFEKWGNFLLDANTPIDLTDDAREIWIWSDQHFHHRNIIRYSERPFHDLDHMHFEMLRNYNSKVKEEDACIWLGDVGFASDRTLNEMLSMFNGYKILVMGNHDVNHERFRELEFDEIHICFQVAYPDVRMCFTHYPMSNLPKPLVNVHGHEHKGGTYYSNGPQHFNVCCEFHDYAPIKLSDVRQVAAQRRERMINKLNSGE